MANDVTYVADVSEEGVITKIYNNYGFKEDIKRLFSGGKMNIKLSKHRKQRSVKQNAMLHAYFTEIADQTKMHPDKVKNAMKAQFLTVPVLDTDGLPIVNPVTGDVLTEVRDTSDLNTFEMTEFVENIRLFVMDFGIYLPLPEEQTAMKL